MRKAGVQDVNRALSQLMRPELRFSLPGSSPADNCLYGQDRVELALKLPFLQMPVRYPLVGNIKGILSGPDKSKRANANGQETIRQKLDVFMQTL